MTHTVTVGGVITAIIGAVVAVLLREAEAWCPRLSQRIIQRAGGQLPEEMRDRYVEEWAREVSEAPGNISKVAFAANLYFRGAPRIQRQARLSAELAAGGDKEQPYDQKVKSAVSGGVQKVAKAGATVQRVLAGPGFQKLTLVLVVAFVTFYIVTSPTSAADIVHSSIHGMNKVTQGFGDFVSSR